MLYDFESVVIVFESFAVFTDHEIGNADVVGSLVLQEEVVSFLCYVFSFDEMVYGLVVLFLPEGLFAFVELLLCLFLRVYVDCEQE